MVPALLRWIGIADANHDIVFPCHIIFCKVMRNERNSVQQPPEIMGRRGVILAKRDTDISRIGHQFIPIAVEQHDIVRTDYVTDCLQIIGARSFRIVLYQACCKCGEILIVLLLKILCDTDIDVIILDPLLEHLQ